MLIAKVGLNLCTRIGVYQGDKGINPFQVEEQHIQRSGGT